MKIQRLKKRILRNTMLFHHIDHCALTLMDIGFMYIHFVCFAHFAKFKQTKTEANPLKSISKLTDTFVRPQQSSTQRPALLNGFLLLCQSLPNMYGDIGWFRG